MTYQGHNLLHLCPDAVVRAGIAQVPEGRRVLTRQSVLDNLRLGAYTRSDGAAVKADIDRQFARFPWLAERRHQLAGTLSGGNQQKVVLARWLASKVKILILDEPTRGVAIGAKLEIWRLINKLVDEGIAVLVISSEATELLANADRIIVMRDGEIAGEVKGEGSSEAELMRLAAGKRH